MWRCNQKPPYYLSAYSLAVKSGFKGTLEEWLASLQGPQGEPGPPGPAGESGIYIGSQEPADPGVDVWIDPDDDDIGSLVGMQSAYYVTITDAGNGSYSADRSFADLTVAHQSDKVLRCRYGVFDLPLTRAIPSVIFEFSGAVDNVLHYITIGKVSDGSTAGVNVGELQLAESADIPNSLPNPNKLTLTGAVSAEYDGSKPVVVDIPEGSDPRVFVKVTDDGDDNFSADMTFAQIKEAYNQNKMVCCNWGGYLMSLSAISSVSAEFSGFSYQTHYRVVIGNYNGVEKVDVYPIQYAERDEIPTTLPNPYKLTFDGAVSGEYDGSRPVNITIPQGGGGSSKWNLVHSLVLQEETSVVNQTVDGYDEYILFIRTIPGSANTNNAPLVIDVHSGSSVERYSVDAGILAGTKAVTTQAYFCKPIGSSWVYGMLSRKGGSSNTGEYGYKHSSSNQITKFDIYTSTLNYTLGTGTEIAIYGR